MTSLQMSISPDDGSSSVVGRRDAFGVASTILLGTAAASIAVSPANAIESCPKGSKNCLRQTWTPASGVSTSDAIAQLRDVLNAYPQEGQNDVDGGGWIIVEDGLNDASGVAKVEYRSSGKGKLAKFFNGGKPFVDDLFIELDGSSFQVRSASRVGDSDFGVNGKRLDYLFAALKGKGWSLSN
eukprot:CAMPEP_0195518406 /NCGR_PEP_ID=MMETSP0794_2-20130614/12820_1 /TAXON_ID=515487 /ORGANISM="Stephanopyxis turris, Strain CCMP 815" /LENGTH=182 /DNA_ID=CAMNT_0040647361 /DNA_START=184 /DNA_END=732 /DNA_ORIENTATION=-